MTETGKALCFSNNSEREYIKHQEIREVMERRF